MVTSAAAADMDAEAHRPVRAALERLLPEHSDQIRTRVLPGGSPPPTDGTDAGSATTTSTGTTTSTLTSTTATDATTSTSPATDTSTDAPDRFHVSGGAGRIEIAGTSPAATLAGLHWYLKYTCGAHISWSGVRLDLPRTLPSPGRPFGRTATVPHRFALNDTHDAYTAPYAGWDHWERFIDLMALHGCNELLVTAGSEAVYHRLLQGFGYSGSEARAWIPAPSHQPWWLLQNMSEFGGPVSEQLLERRAELGRRIVSRMRELGMRPVLPGYFGTVPGDFADRNPGGATVPQGDWNGLPRPAWLDPRTAVFRKVAAAYYAHQRELFGPVGHFKMDLLHEGGDPGSVPVPAAARGVERALQTACPGATWVILGWQENPRAELLEGLAHRDRMLIVDGLSDLERVTDRERDWGGVPYAFGSIPNFGGRTTVGAKTHMWAERFTDWRDRPGSKLTGTAYMPEATHRDPAAFELFSELAWRREPVDRAAWFDGYARLRYGGGDREARRAFAALRNTAYEIGSADGRPHDSVFASRPALSARSGTYFATHTPAFDLPGFDAVLSGLLGVRASLRDSDTYRYDVADAARQVLANRSWLLIGQLQAAYERKDRDTFRRLSTLWLSLMRLSDEVAGTHRAFLLGPWLEDARRSAGGRYGDLAAEGSRTAVGGRAALGGALGRADSASAVPASHRTGADRTGARRTGAHRTEARDADREEERARLERTARVLLTTWAGRPAADGGHLANYANRDWHGLIGDVHLPQWKRYLDELEDALSAGREPKVPDWYSAEEPWTRKRDDHPLRPTGDAYRTAQRVHDTLARAPYQGSVTAEAEPAALEPGGEGEFRAVFRNENGLRRTGKVDFELSGLKGAATVAEGPASAGHVGPGDRRTVRWRVTAPSGPLSDPLEKLPYTLEVAYGPEGERRVRMTEEGAVHVAGPLDEGLETYDGNAAVFGQLGDRFAVNGAGRDLWKGTAEFGAVYRKGGLREGGSVTVRVTSQDVTGPWARAGIVVRNSLAGSPESSGEAGKPGARDAASPGFVNLAVTPSGGVVLSYDADGDGALDSKKQVSGVRAPVLLRLTREGGSFKAEFSEDPGEGSGKSGWRAVATVAVPESAARQDVGLFMTAANGGSGERGTAGFEAWHVTEAG